MTAEAAQGAAPNDSGNGSGNIPAGERRSGWTTKRRETFLDHLAMTGDEHGAAAEAGVAVAMAYALRRRDSRFAEQWHCAVVAGYDRLEAAAIRRALGEGGATIDIKEVVALLQRHAAPARAAGPARAKGGRSRSAAELTRRLKAVRDDGGAAA